MKTFTGYINYGCLAAEKRKVWTAGVKHTTATCSDKVEISIPDGWELFENGAGELCVTAPWGWTYALSEVLSGNEYPRFFAYDKDGHIYNAKLEYTTL